MGIAKSMSFRELRLNPRVRYRMFEKLSDLSARLPEGSNIHAVTDKGENRGYRTKIWVFVKRNCYIAKSWSQDPIRSFGLAQKKLMRVVTSRVRKKEEPVLH